MIHGKVRRPNVDKNAVVLSTCYFLPRLCPENVLTCSVCISRWAYVNHWSIEVIGESSLVPPLMAAVLVVYELKFCLVWNPESELLVDVLHSTNVQQL